MIALLLLGCAPEPTDLVGAWDATLTCDATSPSLPACEGDFGALVEIADDAPPDGTHRSFFPGFPRDDDAYTGMPGPVLGGWDGADVVLELLGDVDDPFASDDDAAAWAAHRLVITGRPSGLCFDGRFAWRDDADTVVVEGVAALIRRGRACP